MRTVKPHSLTLARRAHIVLWLALVAASLVCGGLDSRVARGDEPATAIRLNSIGYLTETPKAASVAVPCTQFSVIRLSDGAQILAGSIGSPVDNADTAEQIFTADFSALTEPGNYVLEIADVGRSAPFRVDDDLYRDPFRTVMRGMYLWRCGTGVHGTHDGCEFSHGPCHTAEVSLELAGGGDAKIPAPGGWHDAGDYNRYVVNGGMTAGVMFRAWEDFGPEIETISLDLPGADGGLPEFLAEMKWQMDWLLAMQADDGSVYCKLSAKNFCGMIAPEVEDDQQYFAPWSSDATADFTAVCAQAARIFRPYDSAFADRCLAAAEKSYAFLVANPDNHRADQRAFRTGRYQSRDWDERLWAAAELWATTGDAKVLEDLETRLRSMRGDVDFSWDWGQVRNLGVLSYLFAQRPGRDPELVDKLNRALVETADQIVAAAARHGYARPLDERYFWGCNGAVARQALVLHAAHRLTGKGDYRETALDALNHLFGRNYYGRSFVTGLGFQPPMHPHDRRSASDDVTAPWPGYLVGGPHPGAKDWQDEEEDYRTNEIAINWNGALIYALAMFLGDAQPAELPRQSLGPVDFSRDWRFAKGDHPDAKSADFDDSQWEQVRLPHDWAITGPFDPDEDGFAAKLPWKGVGWYRKTFQAPSGKDVRVYLEFDGVMSFPDVFINGKLAGSWDYGYTSFQIDATPYLNPGTENVVAVRVDNTKHGTRWYPGAGIYRKVVLRITKRVHFAPWGIVVTTPEVTDASAKIHVRAEIESHNPGDSPAQVRFQLIGPDGRELGADATQDLQLKPGESEVEQDFTVAQPQRWDVTSPDLYTLCSLIFVDGMQVDKRETRFGIRTFAFTADDGFHLNGRRVQLYGVNLHHDLGPLGAAFNRRAAQRQLEIMQEMGVNALRTSHNPSAPEVLDLCDEMGIIVWDECFDKWDVTADRINGQPPFQDHGERHLRNFVLRDRNHPSIVVWSIGNEIPNQPEAPEGKSPERVQAYSDIVRKYDDTRPVGLGCHIPQTANTKALDALDLTGWNYDRRYGNYRDKYPDKPIIYSESASALSTRGFYELPLPLTKTDYSDQHQVDSYDLNAAPWSDIADAEFKLMQDDSFVAGEFVWTGFDYLGEPTPFSRQARSSYFGIVDLCGIAKDRYYLYRSHWRPDTPTLHVLPHWTWPDRVGENVPVFVYTNAPSAELFINGKSQGRRTKGVPPEQPASLALERETQCSSEEANNPASHAVDDKPATRWCAATAESDEWWQVDLGEQRQVKFLSLDFEMEAKNYGYEIQISDDAQNWETVVTKRQSRSPRWGGPRHAAHDVDFETRHIRVQFTRLTSGCWASIREFGAFTERVEHAYYRPTYDYRLRWNDVVYEPGELKVVAYDGDREVGQTIVRTTGPPVALRLTPDRKALDASGEDLSFVLVEAVDADGNVCPLADNLVQYHVDGPGQIAAVGNGNPLSLAPFQASEGRLFYGKAMLIVRAEEGNGGEIGIRAESDGLKVADAACRSQ